MDKKVITDKLVLEKIYNTLFLNKNVFLKSTGFNQKITFIKYEDNKVYLKDVPENYNIAPGHIYIRHADEIVFSQLKPFTKEKNNYVFEVLNVQIMKASRKTERKEPAVSRKTTAVYVSHIISDFLIKDSIAKSHKQFEHLKWELTKKLENKYQYIKIYFLDERASDTRMKHLLQTRSPYFVPDINDDLGTHLSFYNEEIYNSDAEVQNGKFVSEITVPLLYKGMLPFGYIQVNNSVPLSNDQYLTMRKFCISTSELISRDEGLINPSSDRLIVTDLSEEGLGIVFKEKVYIKHFKEKSFIYFVVYFEESKHTSVLTKVMNINLINNVYRIGCTIENIDSIGEVYYTEYLEQNE